MATETYNTSKYGVYERVEYIEGQPVKAWFRNKGSYVEGTISGRVANFDGEPAYLVEFNGGNMMSVIPEFDLIPVYDDADQVVTK